MKNFCLVMVVLALSFAGLAYREQKASSGAKKVDPIDAMVYHTRAMMKIIKTNLADCTKIVSELEEYSNNYKATFNRIKREIRQMEKSMPPAERQSYAKKADKKVDALIKDSMQIMEEASKKCPKHIGQIGGAVQFGDEHKHQAGHEHKHHVGHEHSQPVAQVDPAPEVDTSDAPEYLVKTLNHIKTITDEIGKHLPDCAKTLAAAKKYLSDNQAELKSLAETAEKSQAGMTDEQKKKISQQALALMKPIQQGILTIQVEFAQKCPQEMKEVTETMRQYVK
ncbi:MAG: hypothetical protein JRJ19_01660 [Deltaproteobacteria bacterium]|nr:hypothetical protein [Deltaproteobacteria bacterium]